MSSSESFFLRFRHFIIRLNPYKCVFCVETSRLLGFIVSKDGICIGPLNIEAILALPAPTNVTELQSLHGKEFFLRLFVCNYAERTLGFMRLLKKDTPFVWDDFVQCMFDNLKHVLTHAAMLQLANYIKDYSLYVVASMSTIGMVLVQKNENDLEHVIYYDSKNLIYFVT